MIPSMKNTFYSLLLAAVSVPMIGFAAPVQTGTGGGGGQAGGAGSAPSGQAGSTGQFQYCGCSLLGHGQPWYATNSADFQVASVTVCDKVPTPASGFPQVALPGALLRISWAGGRLFRFRPTPTPRKCPGAMLPKGKRLSVNGSC